nr:acetyl-CoA carboxylase biotin carboxyl carrier protein subunit [uncultured Solibaculum sp.]
MDLQLVAQLINMVTTSSLASLEVEENGTRIKLENGGGVIPAVRPESVNMPAPVVNVPVEVHTAQAVAVSDQAEETEEPEEELYEVKAPMVGIFYSLGSMNRPELKEGDPVKKGSIVCAIEAMKLINEVECDVDGTFVELLVKDGDQVEYGQPLVCVRRN